MTFSAAATLSPSDKPSSVVAFTIMSVTPSRLIRELTSRCVYGTLTGVNSRLAIFM